MRKLGKKLISCEETIEAYCDSCSICGGYCGCPQCTYGTPSNASTQVSMAHVNNNFIGSMTSTGGAGY